MTTTHLVLAGRYRLSSRIAAGGMGEVWRGKDLVLGRPVAIKLLRDEYAQDRRTLDRFRAEARHAGGLSHPGIAQIYDYVEADQPHPPYLVMELVDGPSLTQLLTAGPLDPRRTMDIVAQVAAALHAAHEAGLVHRDIKPANLLVTGGGQVKITDFGIAHAAGSAPITRTGTLIGTPAYLAPERVVGAPATAASDLYSLGIVAYECLTGAPPFTVGTPFEIAIAHTRQSVPPLPGGMPRGVDALVADLTAADPADRPASAGQVAWRASQLRDEIDPSAGPSGPRWDSTVPEIQQHTLVDWRAGQASKEPPGPGKRPRGRLMIAVAAAAALAGAAGLAGWLIGVLGAPSTGAPRPNPVSPAASSTAGLVAVNLAALQSQPVNVVFWRLKQLGLRPVVSWVDNGGPPGQVLSIQPSGQVPVGSTVTIVARRQHGDQSGNGGNQGQGNGGD